MTYKGEMLEGIKFINNHKFLDERGYFLKMWSSEIPMRGSYRQHMNPYPCEH